MILMCLFIYTGVAHQAQCHFSCTQNKLIYAVADGTSSEVEFMQMRQHLAMLEPSVMYNAPQQRSILYVICNDLILKNPQNLLLKRKCGDYH